MSANSRAPLVPAFQENVLQTWSALLFPRRIGVFLLLALPLLAAQREFDKSWRSVGVAAAVVAAFLFLVPAAYRWLFAFEHRPTTLPLRLVSYLLVALIPPFLAGTGPTLFGANAAFITARASIFIIAGLSIVGGYGLGRDIDLEIRWKDAHLSAQKHQEEAEKARLLALKAQLDPHFLFNTLNAIAEWCQEDPKVAEQALLDLSQLLRQIMGGVMDSWWSLAEEISLLRRLFDLHLIRDTGKFKVVEEIDEAALSAKVPPLLLLPLAENVMTHGTKQYGAKIVLRVTRDKERIHFSLENAGEFSGYREGGHGLKSVEQRLQHNYPERASLFISSSQGRVQTQVELPFQELS